MVALQIQDYSQIDDERKAAKSFAQNFDVIDIEGMGE